MAPADALGAQARLALIGAAPIPDRLPAAYVRALFDQYAPHFDRQLLDGLEYRAPVQLRHAVDAVCPPRAAGEQILDLGCGTGLAGEAFRNRACWLEGIDLSPAMVAQARAKGLFDALHVGDLLTLPAAGPSGAGPFDLIVAADVAVYIGDLAPLLARAQALLHANGVFALTVQRSERAGFSLGAECRYSHHPDYVRTVAEGADFEVCSLDHATCRREAGRDVPSAIAVLRPRRAPAAPLTKAPESMAL